ncbi:hypothetical protein C8R43DRAFT_629264 [Mycena crocata]|nr:hypothetical protein C8R43DRAFT_629264 [Mycena crocata]
MQTNRPDDLEWTVLSYVIAFRSAFSFDCAFFRCMGCPPQLVMRQVLPTECVHPPYRLFLCLCPFFCHAVVWRGWRARTCTRRASKSVRADRAMRTWVLRTAHHLSCVKSALVLRSMSIWAALR